MIVILAFDAYAQVQTEVALISAERISCPCRSHFTLILIFNLFYCMRSSCQRRECLRTNEDMCDQLRRPGAWIQLAPPARGDLTVLLHQMTNDAIELGPIIYVCVIKTLRTVYHASSLQERGVLVRSISRRNLVASERLILIKSIFRHRTIFASIFIDVWIVRSIIGTRSRK